MKIGTIVVLVALVVAGFVVNFSPKEHSVSRTEQWLAEQCPNQVGKYEVAATYSMDKYVYDTLDPFGIICRRYSNGPQVFDVVIIASDQPKAFHDPRICFTSQDINLDNVVTMDVPTESHGVVPVTVVEMKQGGSSSLAAYFYKGPSGMRSNNKAMMRDLFVKDMLSGKSGEGVFYRFITMYPGATKDDLRQFIATYLDAADKSSDHYL